MHCFFSHKGTKGLFYRFGNKIFNHRWTQINTDKHKGFENFSFKFVSICVLYLCPCICVNLWFPISGFIAGPIISQNKYFIIALAIIFLTTDGHRLTRINTNDLKITRINSNKSVSICVLASV